jgi:hypothetical protein
MSVGWRENYVSLGEMSNKKRQKSGLISRQKTLYRSSCSGMMVRQSRRFSDGKTHET